MACECPECKEYGGPDKTIMNFRIGIYFSQFLYATYAMARKRKFKGLASLAGSFVFFFPIMRRLVCARCDNYGKNCYSLYLGKVTSWLSPRVEGKKITPVIYALEMLAISWMMMTPVWSLRKNPVFLTPYMGLMGSTLGLQFIHSCRHCALYAEDWRKDCPSAKTARYIYTRL